jgi:hypothetical protein
MFMFSTFSGLFHAGRFSFHPDASELLPEKHGTEQDNMHVIFRTFRDATKAM